MALPRLPCLDDVRLDAGVAAKLRRAAGKMRRRARPPDRRGCTDLTGVVCRCSLASSTIATARNPGVAPHSGTAERDAALAIDRHSPGAKRITLGGDKGFDVTDFVGELRERNVTPEKASATSRQWRSCARQGTAEQRVSASCSRLPQPSTISCESRSYWRSYHDEERGSGASPSMIPARSSIDPVEPAKKPAISDFFRSLLGAVLQRIGDGIEYPADLIFLDDQRR